jgi:hypothetical protein
VLRVCRVKYNRQEEGPAMFQKAPSPGPPPGGSYSTVAYGLMEPFVLIQATK